MIGSEDVPALANSLLLAKRETDLPVEESRIGKLGLSLDPYDARGEVGGEAVLGDGEHPIEALFRSS